jgi:hypothetical protein
MRRTLTLPWLAVLVVAASCKKEGPKQDAPAPAASDPSRVVDLAPGLSATVVPTVDINEPGARPEREAARHHGGKDDG